MAEHVLEESSDRRKSARTTRAPDKFGDEHHDSSVLSSGSTKRKRNATQDENEDNDDGIESESASSDQSDGEPDEEELREKRRQSRNKRTAASHTAKKPKTNGVRHTLAIRSANLPSKSRSKAARTQQARARPSQVHHEGLYAQVFGRDKSGEDAAADWFHSLEANSVDAIRDLVNFTLQCIGCESRVESHDVEDIDNVPSKLGDVLDEFQVNKDAEYPLVSKLKQFSGFRDVLEDFFKALVHSLHTAGTLYDDEAVFDNIQTWVATMSAASLRPFRHTATVISLSISNALCDIASQIQQNAALSRKQMDAEKGKKSVNKGRVKTIENNVASDEKKLESIDALLKDAFDTVFIHRYRDVDDKIRVDCAHALGYWISSYRKVFLEGQYLRYLGWVLSDTNVATRIEVLRQLKTLFKEKRNVAALRAFTERFRPRIVEMGARDADTNVRTEAIELLDKLRNAELLEPDDIDTIGRLVFDAEPRVRKAVSRFFVSNIEDLYGASTEELDKEQYEAALPKADDTEDYLQPTQSWIRFKCLAQTMAGYDVDNESVDQAERQREVLLGDDIESRYMLATQSIYPHLKDLENWETLAGYLLYDHSQTTSGAEDPDVERAVQGCYKLESGEERVLLDVLYYAVKLCLKHVIESESEKKGKRTNASKDAIQERLASVAHNLTQIVPQLLNKFGSTPSAAASILRLEQLLNIDLINELSQGDSTATSILEDISKQFVSHSDKKVLAEASRAFRQARSYEQSKEAADTKVQEIWDDSISTLQQLLKNQSIDTRGTLPINVLTELSNVLSRVANLATISDCTTTLERKLLPAAHSKKQNAKQSPPDKTLLELLVQLARRGDPDEEVEAAFAEIEDELCRSVMATLSLYFRWKVFSLKSAIESNSTKHSTLSTGNLVNLALHRVGFVEVLTPIIAHRTTLDPLRLTATTTTLDIFILFATIRHMKPSKAGQHLPEELTSNLQSLVTEANPELVKEIMTTHAALEKNFARKTRRKIESVREVKEVAVDDAPVDSDDEADRGDDHDDNEDQEDADDDDPTGTATKNKSTQKAASLLAEQRLCEIASKIVLALIARVLPDADAVRQKLTTNRTKLGKSYTQVLAYLDEKKWNPSSRAKGKLQQQQQQQQRRKDEDRGGKGARLEKGKVRQAAEQPLVLEDDDIEDDSENGEEDVEQQPQEQSDEENEEVQEVNEVMGD